MSVFKIDPTFKTDPGTAAAPQALPFAQSFLPTTGESLVGVSTGNLGLNVKRAGYTSVAMDSNNSRVALFIRGDTDKTLLANEPAPAHFASNRSLWAK